MGLRSLFKRKAQVQVHKHTMILEKSKLEFMLDYLNWTGMMPENVVAERMSHFDIKCGDMRSIRILLVSDKNGFHIRPMLIEGSDNLLNPDVLEILPNRKELLGTYTFKWDKAIIYELTIEKES